MITFDTETTGFTKPQKSPIEEQPYLVELGAIKTNDELEIIDSYSELFNIGRQLPPIITEITGILNNDLLNKRSLNEAYDEIRAFFEGEDTWIGHHVMFDFEVLRYNLIRIGKADDFPWPKRKICTIQESLFLKGYRLKLEILHELATGKKIKGWHRAIVDAESTWVCYKWLRETHGVI